MGVTFTTRIPQIAAGMQPKAAAVVMKTGHDIEATWKQLAPVDTGNYVNSVHAEMTGPLTAEVSSGVIYGPFLEYGTRYMAAQPSAVPAAEQNRGPFLSAMKQIVQ